MKGAPEKKPIVLTFSARVFEQPRMVKTNGTYRITVRYRPGTKKARKG